MKRGAKVDEYGAFDKRIPDDVVWLYIVMYESEGVEVSESTGHLPEDGVAT